MVPAAARAQAVPRDTTRRAPRDTSRRDSTAGLPRSRPQTSVAVPPRADSVVVDSSKARDTSRTPGSMVPMPKKKDKGDTLRTPLASAESPPLVAIGDPWRWDRPALYASGALTLMDLLERVPGITGLRAGWLGAPMQASYLGQVDRIRVFYDGLEVDPMDARTNRVLDLSQIQLWTLGEVAIERDADEVRVYVRSWSVNSTNPYTRTDVYTGDEDTNIYRGWFGRRFDNGWALQAGGQQYSTSNSRVGSANDLLGLFLRVGWAKKSWQVDGVMNRTSRTRELESRTNRRHTDRTYPDLSPLDGRNTEAYLRAGWHQPGDAAWAQVIAGSLGFKETSTHTDSTATTLTRPADLVDTSTSRAQYVLAAGARRFGLTASTTTRVRVYGGSQYASPSARIAFDRRRTALSVYAEQNASDATRRLSATARFMPLSFVSLLASAAHRTALDPLSSDSLAAREALGPGGMVAASALRRAQPAQTSLHGEVGLRLRGMWLSGGVMARDTALLALPTVLDTAFKYDTLEFRPIAQGRVTGSFVSLRGKVWKDIFADGWGASWSGANEVLQPHWESRATLGVNTSWLSRFPTNDFGFQFAVTHEYRSTVAFPSERGTLHAGGSRTLSTLLELRIQTAVITWQYRNILGELYEQVPGYEMPRIVNVYGVRWEFWN